jgi:hypothetical protein
MLNVEQRSVVMKCKASFVVFCDKAGMKMIETEAENIGSGLQRCDYDQLDRAIDFKMAGVSTRQIVAFQFTLVDDIERPILVRQLRVPEYYSRPILLQRLITDLCEKMQRMEGVRTADLIGEMGLR